MSHLFASEAASALYKHVRRNEITLDEAQAQLATLLTLTPTFVGDTLLSVYALELAAHHTLKAPYYRALAEMSSCDLWTGDERLYRLYTSINDGCHG